MYLLILKLKLPSLGGFAISLQRDNSFYTSLFQSQTTIFKHTTRHWGLLLIPKSWKQQYFLPVGSIDAAFVENETMSIICVCKAKRGEIWQRLNVI